MRIGVVACNIMKRELDKVLAKVEGVAEVVYLEEGKHIHPPDLRSSVLEEIRAIKDKVDVIFLGYGECQSLTNVIISTLLLVMLCASGGRFLTFNNDVRVFFSDDNPQLRAFEAQEATYTKNHNIQFAVAPKDGDVFTRATLSALEELTEAAWRIPYSGMVDSITNFQHTESVEDDLNVGNLVENAGDLTDEEIAKIKKIALSEPLLLDRQVSGSGHVAGLNVTEVKPEKSIT